MYVHFIIKKINGEWWAECLEIDIIKVTAETKEELRYMCDMALDDYISGTGNLILSIASPRRLKNIYSIKVNV